MPVLVVNTHIACNSHSSSCGTFAALLFLMRADQANTISQHFSWLKRLF
jgi:hypothetical protein